MSILEYINENKEWIFSGVGATGLVIFIKLFKLNKSDVIETQKKIENNKISLSNSNNNSIQIIEKQINNHHSSTSNDNTNVDFTNISPIDIRSEIDNAPLYQQHKIASHYVGLRIKWDLRLFNIIKKDENVILVNLVPINNFFPNIDFEADLKKYPFFKIAKRDQHYCLIGEIIECSTNTIKIGLESIKELST